MAPTGARRGGWAVLAVSLFPALTSAQDPESPPLTVQVGETLEFVGQVGFRLEYKTNEFFAENDSTVSDDHRFRSRVRLRFGGEFTPAHWITAGFRFSTGSPDYPASGWSSFNDQFRRDPVSVDRIYINLNAGDWFSARLGAQSNPLFRPTELVWDNDVQVGGLGQEFRFGRWRIDFGQFILNEYRTATGPKGSTLFANGIAFSPEVQGTLTLGAFAYLYNNPDLIAVAIDEGDLNADFKTNRPEPDDPRVFFSRYYSIGGSVLYASGRWWLGGELVWNAGARRDPSLGPAYENKEDLGFGVLARYGVLTEAWDWSVEAGFFRIEADATIAAFNSDEYQQTNVHSVPVRARLRLPADANLVWDTYFQKRINTALFLAGGKLHDENALKVRTRLTLSLGF
jgi:hypothetical protein